MMVLPDLEIAVDRGVEIPRWCPDLYLHFWDAARVPESLRP